MESNYRLVNRVWKGQHFKSLEEMARKLKQTPQGLRYYVRNEIPFQGELIINETMCERSYAAIRKRGIITNETLFFEFYDKMKEELDEIKDADCFEDKIKETVDLMNVCVNTLVHHGFDPIAEFEKCIIHQETRKD
jgi:hypothetical protein